MTSSVGTFEHFGDNLRHAGVRALPHIDRVGVEHDAAVGADVHDGARGGRRDRRLEADGDAAAAPNRARAAVEWRIPVHALGDALQHLVDRGILHQRAGRLRAAVAQDVLAAEFHRIHPELARDHVGVAFIGPDELRHAEAAQRTRRRPVGVNLGGIDPHVLDVVGTGRREARLLRDARADIGIGAAVPPHIALRARRCGRPW